MNAGYYGTTGSANTFIGNSSSGAGAGQEITTGSNNVIIGGYTGNQGGLDLRTANNNIFLSDGAGNVRFWFDNANSAWRGDILQARLIIGAGDNLNNQKVCGMYRVDVGCANTPTSAYFALIIFGNGDNVVTQIANELATTTTYVRSFNTSWTAWARLDT
jgi:hypothetical protein